MRLVVTPLIAAGPRPRDTALVSEDHRREDSSSPALGGELSLVPAEAMVLMLSSTAHGYDSCPIGGLDKLRIRRLLELPGQAEVTIRRCRGSQRKIARSASPMMNRLPPPNRRYSH